jgi:hypothetical protein
MITQTQPTYVPLTHPTRCPTRARVRTAAQQPLHIKWRRSRADSKRLSTCAENILMAPGSWDTAPQRDASCRKAGNVPGVTAKRGQTVY